MPTPSRRRLSLLKAASTHVASHEKTARSSQARDASKRGAPSARAASKRDTTWGPQSVKLSAEMRALVDEYGYTRARNIMKDRERARAHHERMDPEPTWQLTEEQEDAMMKSIRKKLCWHFLTFKKVS